MAILVYPAAAFFGVVGVALAVIGGSLVVLLPQLYLALTRIDAEMRTLAPVVLYPLLASTAMFAFVRVADVYLFGQLKLLNLFLLIIVGMLSYGVFMATIERQVDYGLFHLYQRIRESI